MSSTAEQSTIRLIGSVLESRDRLRLAGSLAFILVGTLLEMASLGLVIPVVQAVVGGDRRAEYSWLPNALADISYTGFVQVLMVALVAMFIVKNLFLLASAYYQQRVQYSINNRIVQRLFETYLRQPYEFHLSNSSSTLVRNVQEYATSVVFGGIAPVLMVLTDVVTGVGLFAILVVVQPVGTAVMIVFFAISGYLVVALTRGRTERWGAERVEHRGALVHALMAGFGGIKEIKLFGRDGEVLETHRRSLHRSARSSYLFAFALGIPRAFFEVVAVGGVALLVVLATLNDRNLQDATVAVALFGVVAFRMLPSVNRIIQSVQQFSFNRAGIEGAVDGLALEGGEAAPSSARPTDRFARLEVRGLTYRYPNRETSTIDIESLTVTAGESLGVVGASGSGKSTLVDLLIGVLTPADGVISANGRNVADDPRYWQDRIGYVPQHVFLMDTTIRRNVAFGLPDKAIDDAAVEGALSAANVLEFVRSLPEGMDTVVGERGVRLSGGQRQRLGIARALYGNPEVIVLDEATSALDAETEREIVESLREIAVNHTLIVVAHRTSTLAYCSRLIRLDGGRIVQEGSFAEVVGSLTQSTDRGQ
jgi:ABC-type multidrug transport system fused ATPase/permease subunit